MCFLETAVQCKLSEDQVQVTLTYRPSPQAGNKETCLRCCAPHMCVLMADSSRGYYKQ